MTTGATTDGVSYVVPVFNKRRFLRQVVAGLAAQDGGFLREYIFIDDGSTDGSADALEALVGDWPAARILRQANAGPSVTTNRGLREAQYSLVKLVDGDDVLLPGATMQLRDALAQHQAAPVAYGQSATYVDAEDALARLTLKPPHDHPEVRIEQALKPLLRECYLGPSNCLIRRDVALAVGGSDESVFVQDYSLLLRLSTRGPFVAVDAPVVLHPEAPQDRLNDGGPQLLHDTNLTVAHFLAEHEVPEALAAMATRRAMTRAWLWAKRREGATPLSRWYWLRLASYLPLPALRTALLAASCGAFTLSRPVRRSQPTSS
ncbi:MAG TPA: glycosyltransferase family A protein [Stellaceae bacterium]|jgi:cellulose synthase/poly-beta-1,6-N-acetylglucosamine synthase-like glycosyltransferase|nr:glycosyltransferase family A protein [Stellaceae bacterium]